MTKMKNLGTNGRRMIIGAALPPSLREVAFAEQMTEGVSSLRTTLPRSLLSPCQPPLHKGALLAAEKEKDIEKIFS